MAVGKVKWLAWLRDSQDEWNFARITGFVLLIIVQPSLFIYMIPRVSIPEINNVYQWLLLCTPGLTSVLLLLIDVFRDKSSMKIKLGEMELEYNNKINKTEEENESDNNELDQVSEE